ncbi:Tannase and feruloyl esterase [Orbilia ellipsospora]|uniref:Carboxylic ester hydrolase n=1 Tax=Orbilia ellipsospora TaxID=2528407 RepID=A0AAV9WW45_9PEZI
MKASLFPLGTSLVLFLAHASTLLADNTSQQFKSRCNNLVHTFHAANNKVVLSEYVASGTNITNPDVCTPYIVTEVDLCRIRLNITTSPTSSVVTEAWMPYNWQNKGKRYLMTGNGSWGGCITFPDMAYVSSLGFVAVGQNTGHWSNSAVEFTDPEIFKDWVYRSLLVSTDVTKSAVNYFYQTHLTKSYYYGCSTGGRQALKLAETYPEMYDGIIAASPAALWPSLAVSEALIALIIGPEGSDTFLELDQWTAVQNASFIQCDSIDGVVDQVLEDPQKCRFRPESIMCAPGQNWATNQCLTPTQVETVRKIFSPQYGNKGRYIYPRIPPGHDVTQGWIFTYGPGAGFGPQDFLRYVVYNDPTYTIANNFTLNTADLMLDGSWFNLAGQTDLTGLKASGHKLLMYHGLSDPLVTSEASYDYYEDVARNMSLPSSELDSFFRFFPVPGMAHCAFGNGAGFVGGPSQVQYYPPSTPNNIPEDETVIMKLVQWVEHGVAPDTIRGWKIDDSGNPIGAKDHCKWPKRNTYKGHGSPSLSTSWTCT